MKKKAFALFLALLFFSNKVSASCMSYGYTLDHDKGGWYLNGVPVVGYAGGEAAKGVDLRSFKTLPSQEELDKPHQAGCPEFPLYGVDKDNVYFDGKVILEADAKTVSYVGGGYIKDKSHVFYGVGFAAPEIQMVANAVASSFTQIKDENGIFYRDKFHVFYGKDAVPEADPNSFALFTPSGLYVDEPLAVDAHHVFYGAALVRDADPKTVKILSEPYRLPLTAPLPPRPYRYGSFYWVSGGKTFFRNELVSGADRNSFKLSDDPRFNAEDNTHYFCSANSFSKSDCSLIGDVFMRCGDALYAGCKKQIPPAFPSAFDAKSFHYLGIMTKDCSYTKDDIYITDLKKGSVYMYGIKKGEELYQDKDNLYYGQKGSIPAMLTNNNLPHDIPHQFSNIDAELENLLCSNAAAPNGQAR